MNDQSVSGELPFGVRAGVAEDEHVHAPPPLHSVLEHRENYKGLIKGKTVVIY